MKQAVITQISLFRLHSYAEIDVEGAAGAIERRGKMPRGPHSGRHRQSEANNGQQRYCHNQRLAIQSNHGIAPKIRIRVKGAQKYCQVRRKHVPMTASHECPTHQHSAASCLCMM